MELTLKETVVKQISETMINVAETINRGFTKTELIGKIIEKHPLIDANQCKEACERVWLLLVSSGLLIQVKDDYYRILTQRELNAIKKAYMEAIQNENGND